MKKHTMRILAILFAAVIAVCLAVTASAAEKSLSLPKTVYNQNEDILVTAVGEGNDWVGIYARGETPGNPASIYWYYVAQDAEPGEPVDIRTNPSTPSTSRSSRRLNSTSFPTRKATISSSPPTAKGRTGSACI